MQRDDEVELIAMDVAMSFERAEGRNPGRECAGAGVRRMSQGRPRASSSTSKSKVAAPVTS